MIIYSNKEEWVGKVLQRKTHVKKRPSSDQALIELAAQQTQALFSLSAWIQREPLKAKKKKKKILCSKSKQTLMIK